MSVRFAHRLTYFFEESVRLVAWAFAVGALTVILLPAVKAGQPSNLVVADLDFGDDGAAWRTDPSGSIWYNKTGKWQKANGGAVKLAVRGNRVWVVNRLGEIFARDRTGFGRNWSKVQGRHARDIAANSRELWIVGKDGGVDGKIFRRENNRWIEKTGRADQIALTDKGVWAVNSKGVVQRFNGRQFVPVNGAPRATSIGAAANGVWVVGAKGNLHQFDGKTWKRRSAKARNVWINNQDHLYYTDFRDKLFYDKTVSVVILPH